MNPSYRKLHSFNLKSFKWPNLKNKWSDGNYLVIPSWGNFPEWMKIEKCKYTYDLEWNQDRVLKNNDLLFNTGWVWTLWRVWIFKESNIISVPDWFILVIRNEDSEIITKYLFYYFQSIEAKKLIRKYTKWTTWITSIKPTDIFSFDVPYFDIDNQRLIISEIEKQFSRLDEWLSSLLRIRENLKSYRASHLKSAVEWWLTAKWRSEHPDIESANILLDRIRTARWEMWLSENLGKKFKELDELANGIVWIEIPNKWKWSQLGEIIYDGPQNGIYKPSTAYGEWISILRIDDYQNTYIKSKDELRLLKLSENEIELYWLDEFDLVINRVNSMTHLWKSVIIPKTILPCVFESNMMRIKLPPHLSIKYIEFFLHSYIGIKQLQKNAKQAVNQASINQQDVKSVIVPIPPLSEQYRIVEILEEKFSVIDSLESLVNANIRRAVNLKQAILKKAFSWELISE